MPKMVVDTLDTRSKRPIPFIETRENNGIFALESETGFRKPSLVVEEATLRTVVRDGQVLLGYAGDRD